MQKPVEIEALMVESPLASCYFMIKDFLSNVEDIQDVFTNLVGMYNPSILDGAYLKSDDECVTIKFINGSELKVKPYDYIIKEPNEFDNSCKVYIMGYKEFNAKFSPIKGKEVEEEPSVEKENATTDEDGGVIW